RLLTDIDNSPQTIVALATSDKGVTVGKAGGFAFFEGMQVSETGNPVGDAVAYYHESRHVNEFRWKVPEVRAVTRYEDFIRVVEGSLDAVYLTLSMWSVANDNEALHFKND